MVAIFKQSGTFLVLGLIRFKNEIKLFDEELAASKNQC